MRIECPSLGIGGRYRADAVLMANRYHRHKRVSRYNRQSLPVLPIAWSDGLKQAIWDVCALA
jgi:hypothetical protein